ncbi:GIY-YIG nuclease family protein [Rhodococcus sp. NPDC079359]|uniref:GIY-YIG nuclease family protein n=1 Tax=Rhodococcus sp. NPDC079359 TaxID=3154961 RepID=UPI00344C69B2
MSENLGRTDDDVLSEVAAALGATTRPVNTCAAALPSTPGIYSWWADTVTFPLLSSPTAATNSTDRLLYLGLASNLRKRVTQNHLRRSGSSTLRRTLAGLLMDTENYSTRRTDRVVLVEEDERRLTDWMEEHLRLSWVEFGHPKLIETALIQRLQPPLNVMHTRGTNREIIDSARQRYRASATPPAAT